MSRAEPSSTGHTKVFYALKTELVVGQSWLSANLGFGQVRAVCRVSALSGIEVCNWSTDFKANLVTGYCYGLVVIS